MDLTEGYDHLSFAEFKPGNVKRAAHYTCLMLQKCVWALPTCMYIYMYRSSVSDLRKKEWPYMFMYI